MVPFLVPAPEPTPQLETFKKKDVIEILSHKKAYNACKYIKAHGKCCFKTLSFIHVFFLSSSDLEAHLCFAVGNCNPSLSPF